MPTRHLYIHVPFCARRCSYCDFSIAVRSATPVDEYLAALRAELDSVGRLIDGRTFETVYFGGGTPSRLGVGGIRVALAAVRDHAFIARDAEITLEANPDDISDTSASEFRAAGINRVSLGAQSFDDAALKWMHRVHDSTQIGLAVQSLRSAGIENISLDLIFSLPPQIGRSWEYDLARAVDLEPTHISLYGLTVEPKTPIYRWASRGVIVQGTEETYEREFLTAHDMMTAAGFDHYEVSNFARPGMSSRHNSAYWTGEPYVGIGPSAHSFDGSTRRWNVSAYSAWIRRLASGGSAIEGAESLTVENRSFEEVYLGLRTRRGLAISAHEMNRIRSWESAGWAVVDDPLENPRVRLTPTGWLRLDSLASDLASRRPEPATAA
ncbi:MAG TPA: radical SAM family heme chaperone HemW [Gemmatimonadaceae bacterium]|nr:radical SAM family heme chaperone HemW [Gemmatimonadaceae bacterium]